MRKIDKWLRNFPPKPRNGNHHRFPVFCDRPASNVETPFVKDLRDTVVAQRLVRILSLEDLFDAELDFLVRNVFSALSADAFAEEVAEFMDAEIRLHVFSVDDAADRRDIHLDHGGDVLVDHRLQPVSKLEELPLLVTMVRITRSIVSRR